MARRANWPASPLASRLAASIFAGGPATGASLNPSRTLGPALIAGNTSYLIPYLIGIFGGGIVAGLVQGNVLNSADEPAK